jgi:16S rRNA (guanine527-N7)-methyltransferase
MELPELDDGRAVVAIKKVKPSPKAYPRKAGLPEKHPLE